MTLTTSIVFDMWQGLKIAALMNYNDVKLSSFPRSYSQGKMPQDDFGIHITELLQLIW